RAGHRRGADQTRILAGADRRRVRGGSAVGDDPGRFVQAVGEARVPHVPAPPPFRARRLGRIAGGAAVLHRRRAARAVLALDAQTAMTIDLRHPLPGRRPLVMGAGRSGLAAARLLVRHGVAVRVCDARGGAALEDSARDLRGLGVEVQLGADGPSQLEGCDFVIWSPGIALTHPLAVAALAAGIPVLSELELGSLASQAPLVCVTGTNGKSTTTDLVGALIRATGREVEVCGNIGRAICEVAERVGPTGLLVTEVSSFQLETVQRLKPFIATWLNLTPDHLDRHGDLERYGAVKQRLFARQDEGDYAVWNA